MLENVQCEAKNLKLLLNLKEEQLMIYETKNIELESMNESLSETMERMKAKMRNLEIDNEIMSKELQENRNGRYTEEGSDSAINIMGHLMKSNAYV
jgi:hypothetical protein